MGTGRLKVWLLLAVACMLPLNALAQGHSDTEAPDFPNYWIPIL